jgi:GNAT superfamily N-acetyltransferase
MTLEIQPAAAGDGAAFLDLVAALADYEKLPRPDAAARARLLRDGFGPAPRFETLLARLDGSPVGYALYFYAYSSFLAKPTLWLEDLFVMPEARGRGVGLALLRRLGREAAARECGRMEWTVLDWNRPAIEFYDRLGARPMSEWTTFRLDGAALAALGAAGA